jgi:hypothetical protein
VSGINIGTVHKRDVLRANVMNEKGEWAVQGSILHSSTGQGSTVSNAGLLRKPCFAHQLERYQESLLSCEPHHIPATCMDQVLKSLACVCKCGCAGAKKYAVILAFDVPVAREAREQAEEFGVRIFTADIIYHLFDQFTVSISTS